MSGSGAAAAAVKMNTPTCFTRCVTTSSLLFGAAFLITALVVCLLHNGEFVSACSYAAFAGGGLFFFGLISRCCDFCTEEMQMSHVARLAQMAALTGAAAEPTVPTVPTVLPEPIPMSTTTKDFFESRGVFGVPDRLIKEIDIWRRYRTKPKAPAATAALPSATSPSAPSAIPLSPSAVGAGVASSSLAPPLAMATATLEDSPLKFDGGIIFYGPPGNGKTTIAKHVATLLGGKHVEPDGGSILGMYVGETQKNIKALFAVPKGEFHVLEINELETVFAARGGGKDSWGKASDQAIGQALVSMNGIARSNPDYICIGTTNLPGGLDSALVRDGRMGIQIKLDDPNLQAREQIFRYRVLRQVSYIDLNERWNDATFPVRESGGAVEKVDIARFVAMLTKGYSCAALGTVASNAFRRAEGDGRTLTILDVLHALRESLTDNISKLEQQASLDAENRGKLKCWRGIYPQLARMIETLEKSASPSGASSSAAAAAAAASSPDSAPFIDVPWISLAAGARSSAASSPSEPRSAAPEKPWNLLQAAQSLYNMGRSVGPFTSLSASPAASSSSAAAAAAGAAASSSSTAVATVLSTASPLSSLGTLPALGGASSSSAAAAAAGLPAPSSSSTAAVTASSTDSPLSRVATLSALVAAGGSATATSSSSIVGSS